MLSGKLSNEYSYFQSVYLGSFACRIGWIKLFQMTVLYNVEFDDLHWRWHTMQILYNAQSFFMLFFWMMSILLNTVICYDLMFILYHPFKSPQANVVTSLAVSIIVSSFVAG